MTQLDVSIKKTPEQAQQHHSQLHDLRDKLNTIMTSAMVLERVGAVSPEHQKYLGWILEKTNEANELVDQFSSEASKTEQ